MLARLTAIALLLVIFPFVAPGQVQGDAKCPMCSSALVSVPILIGYPSKQMAQEERAGRALLGGCVGDPSRPKMAFVCLKCRQWKKAGTKIWQDLSENFGKDAAGP